MKPIIGINRKIDNLGRATIPRPIRDRLGVDYGDQVEFCMVEEGVATIRAAVADDRRVEVALANLTKAVEETNPKNRQEILAAIAALGEKVKTV